MSGSEIKVLDHGFVRLDGVLADDLSVVNSARVSFAQRSNYELVEDQDEQGVFMRSELSAKDVGLIGFLMKNRHGTPFEHNTFRFHVKAPLFVFREWQRHRISSFNEWSARYSKLENEFYIPKREHIREQVGKPGAYSFRQINDPEQAQGFAMELAEMNDRAFRNYETAIEVGIAKEQARLFLPVGIYSQMYWTVNARSLMNFLSLRNSEQAMYEIAEFAIAVEAFFHDHMPITHGEFVNNGRVAP